MVRELVDALGRNTVADLTDALQYQEVDRWLDGTQWPLTLERERLLFAYSMLVEARQQGIGRKTFKSWMKTSRIVEDTANGCNISPCRALKQRMYDGVGRAFTQFCAGN